MRKLAFLIASLWCALNSAGAARADIIQSYDVSGTDQVWVSSVACGPVDACPVYQPGTFSGHITVDLSTNTALDANILAGSPFIGSVWVLWTDPVLPDISLLNSTGQALMFLSIDLVDNTVAGGTTRPTCPSTAGCGPFIRNMQGTLTPAVPEPSTWAMLLIGFAGIGFMAYRRKSKPALMAA